jgi:hypothetical protein
MISRARARTCVRGEADRGEGDRLPRCGQNILAAACGWMKPSAHLYAAALRNEAGGFCS